MIISKAFWLRTDHSASRMTTGERSAVRALDGCKFWVRNDTISSRGERLPYRTAVARKERGILMTTTSRTIEREARYHPNAYHFVYDALRFTQQTLNRGVAESEESEDAHISGVELLGGIREFALLQFGLLTRTVFRHWGIRSTGDFRTNRLRADQPRQDEQDRSRSAERFLRRLRLRGSLRPQLPARREEGLQPVTGQPAASPLASADTPSRLSRGLLFFAIARHRRLVRHCSS